MVKRKEINLEESPLLSNSNIFKKIDDMPSTINPNKLDKARFTEIRQRNENKSSRIILLILLVIGLGVGSTLIVRNLAINNLEENSNVRITNTPTPTTTQNKKSSIIFNTLQKQDSEAQNPPKINDFIDSIMVNGGIQKDLRNVILEKIQITSFQTFNRIEFLFSSEISEVPQYKINFDDLKKIIEVQFIGLENFDEGLTYDQKFVGTIKEIRFDTLNKKHLIFFNEPIKYRVTNIENTLVIDFISTLSQNNNQNNSNNTISTNTPTPKPTTTVTTTNTQQNILKPTPPFFENQFSKNKQFISSNVNTNSILHNTFAVEDTGPYFEFTFASRNNVGNNFIPNAAAYWEGDVLILEIENLARTFMFDSQTPEYKNEITATTLQNNLGINMNNANFVKIKLKSYTNGKAIYEITTKNKADFRILAKVVDIVGSGPSQGIAIQIKD